jgi:hypothetical protein
MLFELSNSYQSAHKVQQLCFRSGAFLRCIRDEVGLVMAVHGEGEPVWRVWGGHLRGRGNLGDRQVQAEQRDQEPICDATHSPSPPGQTLCQCVADGSVMNDCPTAEEATRSENSRIFKEKFPFVQSESISVRRFLLFLTSHYAGHHIRSCLDLECAEKLLKLVSCARGCSRASDGSTLESAQLAPIASPPAARVRGRECFPSCAGAGLRTSLRATGVDASQVRMRPPLLPYGEILQIQQSMAAVHAGEAFLLQAGDCAERFEDCSRERLQRKHGLLMQMAALIELLTELPVVVLGRYGATGTLGLLTRNLDLLVSSPSRVPQLWRLWAAWSTMHSRYV